MEGFWGATSWTQSGVSQEQHSRMSLKWMMSRATSERYSSWKTVVMSVLTRICTLTRERAGGGQSHDHKDSLGSWPCCRLGSPCPCLTCARWCRAPPSSWHRHCTHTHIQLHRKALCCHPQLNLENCTSKEELMEI